MAAVRVEAIAFDKDGTLLDFDRTWDGAMLGALQDAAPDPVVRRRLAETMGFDLDRACFLPDAPARFLSNAELAVLADAHVDGQAFIERTVVRVAGCATAMPGAAAALATLRARAVPLAVVTNDEERSTREQLASLGWADVFDVVVGYDSGHGAKPDPGPVRAAAAALGVPVARLAMVGDSLTDLTAARAAGAHAVLVGRHPDPRRHAELTSLADRCLDRVSAVVELASS